MKVHRYFFAPAIVSFITLGVVILGTSRMATSTQPHICYPNNTGTISTHPSHSFGTYKSTFTFYYQANSCGGHNSSTLRMGVRIYNNSVFPPAQICSDGEPYSTNSRPVPPNYYTVNCPSSGSLPANIKAVIDYTTNGSTWMTSTDYFKNP
jgi:hypothetical protein